MDGTGHQPQQAISKAEATRPTEQQQQQQQKVDKHRKREKKNRNENEQKERKKETHKYQDAHLLIVLRVLNSMFILSRFYLYVIINGNLANLSSQ